LKVFSAVLETGTTQRLRLSTTAIGSVLQKRIWLHFYQGKVIQC
jgi:hypothetical protein